MNFNTLFCSGSAAGFVTGDLSHSLLNCFPAQNQYLTHVKERILIFSVVKVFVLGLDKR